MAGISCARRVNFAQQDHSKVLKVAREYHRSGQHASLGPLLNRLPVERPISSPGNVDDEELYEGQVKSYFDQGNFDKLEQTAEEARVSKGRFVGGVWKLYGFYFAIGRIPEGQPTTDAVWDARLARLKKWESARPESVTARAALAEVYVNYAWDGRGSEAANEVTQDQWQRQVLTHVNRGAGEATLKDEFDVPARIKMIRVSVPLIPVGYTETSGQLVLEYPIRQK